MVDQSSGSYHDHGQRRDTHNSIESGSRPGSSSRDSWQRRHQELLNAPSQSQTHPETTSNETESEDWLSRRRSERMVNLWQGRDRRETDTHEAFTFQEEILATGAREDIFDALRERHRQRMQPIAEALGIDTLPSQADNNEEWSSFAARAYENLVEKHSLNRQECTWLGDMLKGGIDLDVNDTQRDSDRYKQIMRWMLEEWRDRNNTENNA